MIVRITLLILGIGGGLWPVALQADPFLNPLQDQPFGMPPEPERFPTERPGEDAAQRVSWLPTERETRSAFPETDHLPAPMESWNPPDFSGMEQPFSPVRPASPPRHLLPFRFDGSLEWEGKRDGISLFNQEIVLTQPLSFVPGYFPPDLIFGFSHTGLESPARTGLPDDLFDLSLGVNWLQPFSEQWLIRVNLTAALATDFDNTSSDAWQFRGGFFSIHQVSPAWQWVFGALATGRDDIPVLPAGGTIWTPDPRWNFNLLFPQPRISYLLTESVQRQNWLYFGAGITGGTWAFQSPGGMNDLVSYREWRLSLGLDSRPPGQFGQPGPGLAWESEIAYVLGRAFEYTRRPGDFSVGDTVLLRARLRF